jgi:hypothetical protein
MSAWSSVRKPAFGAGVTNRGVTWTWQNSFILATGSILAECVTRTLVLADALLRRNRQKKTHSVKTAGLLIFGGKHSRQ